MWTPGLFDRWDSIPWKKVIHEVTRQQRRIAKAVQQKQFGKAKRLMYLLSKSFYAKLLAVRRVTMNKGKYTPGVDGKVWLRGPEKLDEAKNLRTRGYSPKPLRRVYISMTANGKIIYRLYKLSIIPIIYHVKIKSQAIPYLPEYDKYFLHRTKWRQDRAKKCRQITTFECTV